MRRPRAAGPYKDTVNLPVTRFNMRANSVQREPELQARWAEQRTYEQLRDGNPGVGVWPLPACGVGGVLSPAVLLCCGRDRSSARAH